MSRRPTPEDDLVAARAICCGTEEQPYRCANWGACRAAQHLPAAQAAVRGLRAMNRLLVSGPAYRAWSPPE